MGVLKPGNSGQSVSRYVPLWDFDAHIEPFRDTSAGVVAANGMIFLYQILTGMGSYQLALRYLEAATTIVNDTIDYALARQIVRMQANERDKVTFHDVGPARFDGILKHATVNNNASSLLDKKAKNHGIVYADYYLIEFGTQLPRLAIC